MPLIPDGYANVTLNWVLDGAAKQYSCVVAAGSGVLATAFTQDLADAWYDALTSTDRPCAAPNMSIGWTFVGIDVLLRDATTGDQSTASAGPPVVGTGSLGSPPQELVPAYTPMVITKRTALAGRHGRGRLYPPLTNGTINFVDYNGTINTTRLGFIQTEWSDFLDDVNSTTGTQMVLTHDTVTTSVANKVTSLVCRPVVASQRRRKVRG